MFIIGPVINQSQQAQNEQEDTGEINHAFKKVKEGMVKEEGG